ncbi:uncharacterized protein LOC113311695 [Papaver somniferum]|uniref:uncharacterized protein LOC113311695 n=1 Tax=Papaver somniferum TaxID=3469 RepID=UPI000E6F6D72|nr:uncharacterized protein LOC113311695 [Papaver somniferum]
MTSYLGNHQFGVGIPCGGEGIVHSVNRLLELKGDQNTTTMLLIDFTNAFNIVDRTAMLNEVRIRCPSISKWVEFCYAHPAKLYYNESILFSAQGVQQGDPLGPLLFSLVLQPLVTKISSTCKLDLHAWYLDDDTLIGDTLEVPKGLQIIQQDGPARGLCLNIRKTEIYWPTPDPRCCEDGVFPSAVGRHVDGVKLLGGPVSTNNQYCSDIISARIDKTTHLMDCIKRLKDPQSELLLLRNCAGVSKLYFTMKTTRPSVLQRSRLQFDQHLIRYLQHLITGDGPGFGPLQQRIATLPFADGGLGIYTMADTTKYCYIASCLQTRQLQSSILQCTTDPSPNFQEALDDYVSTCDLFPATFNINDFTPQPMHQLASRYFEVVTRNMRTSYTLSTRDSILWQCNKKPHAQDYLKAIPIQGLNQSIGPRQFRSVLQYRLGIPIFEENSTCSCCKREMDRFGDHTIHCASEVGLKYRHDMVRDLFVELCYKAGVAARKEASLGLTSNTNTPLKPADIMVFNWENGKDTCFDVTGVSPFSKGGNRSFTPGHAISAAITRKRNKYASLCLTHGYEFGVLSFSTLGELDDDIIVLVNRLKNCMESHDVNNNLGSSLFHRLVSLDMNFCSNVVLNRVDKTFQLIDKIQELHDPQCELLLLRNCTGVSRLYFSIRTTCPKAIQNVATRFDDYLMQYLRRLIVGDGAGFGLV